MNAPSKFLFDVDFAAGGDGKKSAALADDAAKIKAAEEAGYRSGFAAAENQAKVDAQRREAAALEHIAAALDALEAGLSTIETQLESEAVKVAVAVARKLSPALIEREPLEEIAALATSCFRELVAAPHIVVRVNDTQHETARERLDELAHARGFDGRLVVLGDPEIAAGDCRIEWADGGVNRDRAATEAAIGDAVNRYVAGRHGTVHMPEVSWRSNNE